MLHLILDLVGHETRTTPFLLNEAHERSFSVAKSHPMLDSEKRNIISKHLEIDLCACVPVCLCACVCVSVRLCALRGKPYLSQFRHSKSFYCWSLS